MIQDKTKQFLIACLTDANSFNANLLYYRKLTSIANAIDYAWNNWLEDITATFYPSGAEKPKYPPDSFIEDWIENEDFEADGYDLAALNEMASGGK